MEEGISLALGISDSSLSSGEIEQACLGGAGFFYDLATTMIPYISPLRG
jgi:hypothetical protein